MLSFYQQQPESATTSRLFYELTSNHEQITLYISTTGIPDAMRCEMWQLLCGSKERMKRGGGAQYVVVEKPKP